MNRRESKDIGPRDLSANYRALADATRLRILRSLWQSQNGPGATVTDLCEELRVSQPLMSWHLRILRRAGLVTTSRAGRLVHCSIDSAVVRDYGLALEQYLRSESETDVVTVPADKRIVPEALSAET